MYFITTICPDDSRCVGYFSKQKDAIEAVENNSCDLNEAGCYPHAVIEHIKEGLYEYDFEPMWFTYDKTINKYKKSNPPSYIQDNSVGFGIG